jgi:hypothetical protein
MQIIPYYQVSIIILLLRYDVMTDYLRSILTFMLSLLAFT